MPPTIVRTSSPILTVIFISFLDFSIFSAAITSPTRKSIFRKSSMEIFVSDGDGERFLEGEEGAASGTVDSSATGFSFEAKYSFASALGNRGGAAGSGVFRGSWPHTRSGGRR